MTRTEIKRRLPGVTGVNTRPVLTRWDRRVAPGLARLTRNRFGWFLLITGPKPRQS